VVPALLVWAYPLVAHSPHQGSPHFHAAIELAGGLIALVTGLALVTHADVLASHFHLIVGIAFLVSGGVDLVHGFMALESALNWMGIQPVSLERAIAATYVTGRLLMGALLLEALRAGARLTGPARLRREAVVASVAAVLAGALLTLLAFGLPMPALVYPALVISQPMNFIAMWVLAAALATMMWRYWAKGGMLVWWLALATGMGVSAEVMMSFSRQSHDSLYDLAHVYKMLGYVTPLLGFTFYRHSLIRQLMRAQEALRAARDDLEVRVQERTAELKRSNEELEHFAYVASHDLQEPLRMVSGFLELLAQRYKGHLDDKAHEYIGFAVDGAARMRALIRDLLSYSRVGRGGKAPTPTSAEAAMADALLDLHASVAESGAEVTHDPLPTVLVDGAQLVQLLRNLIGSAIKFRSNAPPRIHVSAIRDGNECTFSVSDNGIGIAPEHFGRIFQIFQRLHTRDRYPGTGIGLAVCKKIVERYGGRIWVESQPGNGSTFRFTLPAAKETTS